MPNRFDLIIIGAGPAGEAGALEAARHGKSVALIDQRFALGGNSSHTGSLPSKTMREASIVLSRAVDHAFLPAVCAAESHPITMGELMYRTKQVIEKDSLRMRSMIEGAGITVLTGFARFRSDHLIMLEIPGQDATELLGDHILIACGSRPLRPSTIPFDGVHIFDSDELLQLTELPKSLLVLGAGVIGSEYSTIFSNLGIPVQLLDAKPTHLPFIDQEIISVLHQQITKRPLTLVLGTAMQKIAVVENGVEVTLVDGRVLRADAALYAMGRASNADQLDLDKSGVQADARHTIGVDQDYLTNVPHIAAAGDVIGFPALAATSWDQGRCAVRRLFALQNSQRQHLLPFGIYTIPEISAIGVSEADARTAGTSIVIGRCHIGNTARGIISGDEGLLKLIFDATSQQLIGAHCIGARATDIIHAAMFCIHFHGTVHDLADAVFNYPTVSDAIKIAALDAMWQSDKS